MQLLLLVIFVFAVVLGIFLLWPRQPMRTGGDDGGAIIHVSGPSGVGKSTFGAKIKSEFPSVIVADADDLLVGYLQNTRGAPRKREFQRYLDDFLLQHRGKTVVITGLLNFMHWDETHYFTIPATHRFYITADPNIILTQKCLRWFKNYPERSKKMIVDNNRRFCRDAVDAIESECDAADVKRNIKKWDREHKEKYVFGSADKILDLVSKVISG